MLTSNVLAFAFSVGIASAVPTPKGGGGGGRGGFSSSSSSGGRSGFSSISSSSGLGKGLGGFGGRGRGSSAGLGIGMAPLAFSGGFLAGAAASSDTSDEVPGCHEGMNWWIYTKPDWDHVTSNETYIAVGSQWNINHNKNVRKHLKEEVGLKPLNQTGVALNEHCFWQTDARVSRLGVDLAWIDHHSYKVPYFAVAPQNETAPYELNPELKKRMIETIHKTYPTTEILLLVLSITGGVALLCASCVGLSRWRARRN